jgi:hypothetical protein
MSGKFILIGVYTGEMNVNNGPATIPLSIWMNVTGLSAGKQNLELVARKHVGLQRTEIARMHVGIEVNDPKLPVALPLQGLGVSIDSDCSISLYVTCAGEPERLAGSLKVNALFAEKSN